MSNEELLKEGQKNQMIAFKSFDKDTIVTSYINYLS